MQKQGFTLTEVLVSVGIVGILAAVMLPMMNKYKPDAIKAKWVKTYNTINEILPELASNRNVYPLFNEGEQTGDKILLYNEYPLFNLTPVKVAGETVAGDSSKFCRLLAMNLKTTETLNCPATYNPNPEFKTSFETRNGVQFMVLTRREISGNDAVYQSDIYIDVNGKRGANTFEGPEQDRFKLMVNAAGKLVPADDRGLEFLKTSGNWKLDRDLASGGLDGVLPDKDLKTPLEYAPWEVAKGLEPYVPYVPEAKVPDVPEPYVPKEDDPPSTPPEIPKIPEPEPYSPPSYVPEPEPEPEPYEPIIWYPPYEPDPEPYEPDPEPYSPPSYVPDPEPEPEPEISEPSYKPDPEPEPEPDPEPDSEPLVGDDDDDDPPPATGDDDDDDPPPATGDDDDDDDPPPPIGDDDDDDDVEEEEEEILPICNPEVDPYCGPRTNGGNNKTGVSGGKYKQEADRDGTFVTSGTDYRDKGTQGAHDEQIYEFRY